MYIYFYTFYSCTWLYTVTSLNINSAILPAVLDTLCWSYTFTRTLLLSYTTGIHFLKLNSISVSQQSQHFYVLMGVFDKPFSYVCHAINPFTENHLNSFSAGDVVMYIYMCLYVLRVVYVVVLYMICASLHLAMWVPWRAFVEGSIDRHAAPAW